MLRGVGLSSGLSSAARLRRRFNYFVDSVAGSDSNSGTSPAQPWATLGKLTSAGVLQAGVRIGLKRGSLWREQLPAAGVGSVVGAYGGGARPIISGDRVIAAAAWIRDATYSNVWFADVTHEVSTTPHPSDPNGNTFHVAVYFGDTLLTGYFAGADIAANRAFVNSNAGTFTAHRQGQTAKDPRADSAGSTLYRYYVRLPADADPTVPANVVTYCEQRAVALLANDGTWRGLEFRRTAVKDMTGHASGSHVAQEVSDCVFRDAPCHGTVIRARQFFNNWSYGRTDGKARLTGGGGFNFFYDQAGGTVTPPMTISDNYVYNFSSGLYSHGANTTSPAHASLLLQRNRTELCAIGVQMALSQSGTSVDDHVAIDCTVGTAVAGNNVVYRRWSYLSPTTGSNVGISTYGNPTFIDSSFVFRTSGLNAAIAQNTESQALANDALVHTITFQRCSNKGGEWPVNNSRWMRLHIVATDSVLGNGSAVEAPSLLSITATNSFISERRRTVAEMVAAGATLTSCVSPWQAETSVITVGAGDVTEFTSARTMTGTAGSTSATMSFTDLSSVNAIRVLDYSGSLDFDTWLTARVNANTSNGTVTLHDPAPAAFTNRPVSHLRYNKRLTFSGPLRDRTTSFPAYGPSFSVADGAFSLTGTQKTELFQFDGGGFPFNVGTTGTTPSLGDPQINSAAGWIDAGFDVRPGSTLTVSAVVDHAADVVWAGSPDTTGDARLAPSSPLFALGMGRAA